ncbi:uncharacterized protein TNCV_1683461 [Trichonephila clavipes]|nr:uncharacterized protein TNCV_1683461 [Trichonephila clavipes]
MDEQLKALLEGINALKGGQEETKERMEKGQQEMQKYLEIEDLEKKLLVCWNEDNERKFVPASPVPVLASPVSVKLSTYDGKTNWEVYKTQFSIISDDNGWTEGAKACQLAASLRGEAAEFLQTFPDIDYARLQKKTRLQRTG